MNEHWTEKSEINFLFRIVSDFISQIEKKMESLNMSQDQLAKDLHISKGRVSQVLNNPGNVSLRTVIKLAKTLKMKVSIIAYDDNDFNNINGPIISEVFKICWENAGKPHDLFSVQKSGELEQSATNMLNFCYDLEKGKNQWIYQNGPMGGAYSAQFFPINNDFKAFPGSLLRVFD